MKKEIYNLEGIEIEVEKYDIKDMQKRYIPEKGAVKKHPKKQTGT